MLFPVLSCGAFGFIRHFYQGLIVWGVEGFFNGNVATCRTVVTEVVGHKKFLSRAFVEFTISTNLAILLSPVMGGQLADLAGGPPERFGNSRFWKNYPYALPALVNMCILLLAFFVVFFFLEETSPFINNHRDRGLAISSKVVSWFVGRRKDPSYARLGDDELSSEMEAVQLIPGDKGIFNASRKSRSIEGHEEEEDDDDGQRTASSSTLSTEQKRKIPPVLPLRRIWTRNFVLMLITSSMHDGHLAAYTALWVNFLSDPVVRHASGDTLPFRFSGGVGMAPSDIGWTLSVIGVLGLPLQFLVYTRFSQRLGALRTWRLFMRGFPIIYTIAPYVAVVARLTPSSMPEGKHSVAVWVLAIFVQLAMIGCAVFVTPSQLVLVRLASPHPSAIARAHSVAFVTSGAVRALSASLSALVYSYGTSHALTGLAFWLSAVVSVCVCCLSLVCREGSGHEIWLSGDVE